MSKNTTTTKTRTWGWKGIISLVAYVAVCCIGISLLVAKIGVGSIAGAFHTVAEVLAYIVTSVVAFGFAIRKRHWAYFTVWVVCVVLIVVLMIIK